MLLNKPEVLYFAETNPDFNDGTLTATIDDIKKSLDSDELSQYAALLKASGKTHAEICEMVDRSPSWIKKYVNPKLSWATQEMERLLSSSTEVTMQDGFDPEHVHEIIGFDVGELQKVDRTFEGWGSVEVKDSQEDIIPIKALEKVMPTYMKRGSPIMFGHSNRHVGKILKYDFRDKQVNGKSIPGLWLRGTIFNDYEIDHKAWDALKMAQSLDKAVLSLGATPLGVPKYECNESECYRKFDNLQLYEFTVTPAQKGIFGSNPEATVDKTLAKAYQEPDETLSDSAWLGGKLLKMQRTGSLPQSDDELVNLMLGTCGSCQDEFQELLKTGSSELEAKETILEGLKLAMKSAEVEIIPDSPDLDKQGSSRAIAGPQVTKLAKKAQKLKKEYGSAVGKTKTAYRNWVAAYNNWAKISGKKTTTPGPKGWTTGTVTKQDDSEEDEEMPDEEEEEEETKENDVTAILQEILARIKALEEGGKAAPSEEKSEEDKEEEEKDPDKDKDKESTTPPKEPVLTLSKFDMKEDQFDTLAAQMGYKKVGEPQKPDLSKVGDPAKKGVSVTNEADALEKRLEAVSKRDISMLQ